jgi:hypothetical protein
VKLKRMTFSRPSERLRTMYEAKKAAYLKEFYTELLLQAQSPESGGRGNVPEWAWRALLELSEGKTQSELAEKIGLSREWTNRLLKKAPFFVKSESKPLSN